MLIASFVGLEKTLELYELAIKQRYRFYSYGDGMLII
jgi:S-adenosylmethionine:tRNA ribosyltransferase-isomerase